MLSFLYSSTLTSIPESESHSAVSDSLRSHGIVHEILQARILGWAAVAFSRGPFLTQGLNPSLPHCRRILYQLSHQGSARILEWVAFPFSSGSSQPRNWTRVSCIAGGFFTNWAIKELMIITSSLDDSSRHRPTHVRFGGNSDYKSRPAHVAMTS